MQPELNYTVNAHGVRFELNGQVVQYDRAEGKRIAEGILASLEHIPAAEEPVKEPAPGDVVTLTAEEHAALVAAAGKAAGGA